MEADGVSLSLFNEADSSEELDLSIYIISDTYNPESFLHEFSTALVLPNNA